MCLITIFKKTKCDDDKLKIIKISLGTNEPHKINPISGMSISINLCGIKWLNDVKISCIDCGIFGDITTINITGKIRTLEIHNDIKLRKLKKIITAVKPDDIHVMGEIFGYCDMKYKCSWIDFNCMDYSQLKLFAAPHYEIDYLKINEPQLINVLQQNYIIYRFNIRGKIYEETHIINNLIICYPAIYLSLHNVVPRPIINIIASYAVC